MLLPARLAPNSSILTYRGSLDRAGHYVMPGLTYERARGLRLDPSFNATFPGQVYAQPLLWREPKTGAGVLIVATEEDEVYALDEKTGAQKWMQKLGEPVLQAGLRCGNIWPLGVTGTPVIDPARATLYLDAAVMRDGPRGTRFMRFRSPTGRSSPAGRSMWRRRSAEVSIRGCRTSAARSPCSAAGSSFPSAASPAIAANTTGWSSAFRRRIPARPRASRPAGASGGIWAPGGVTGDGKSLFAATGNTIFVKEWGDGEAVLRFAPDLARPVGTRDYFRSVELAATSTLRISISAEPRRFRSTSRAPKASGS